LLSQEISRNMAMMGINRLNELSPASLIHVGKR
jgi:isopentenyl diphosphate isomerase/L-lactate dehydrogenase-like FMN-dependent dehydrogenase